MEQLKAHDVKISIQRATLPNGTEVWSKRWCQRKKKTGDMTIVQSRLVVRQFRDFNNTENYAPTPGHEAIRLLIAIGLVVGDEMVTGDFI